MATDGFFAISGRYVGLTEDEALASLKVVVTDDAGHELPGDVSFIEHTLAWTAKQPLTVGARLSASLTATPISTSPVGGDYTLEVVGEPDALPAPTWDALGWTENYRGVGNGVMCPGIVAGATGGSCGSGSPPPQFVSTAYEPNGGFVDLQSTTQPKAGVLWLVSIEQSSKAGSTLYYSSGARITGPQQAQQGIGRVGYSADATEACTVVVIKDLRTGKEARSDTCHDLQATDSVFTSDSFGRNDLLGACTSPPSEAARDVWCRARRPIDPTCTPSEPADTSPGCQVGPAGSAGGWLLAVAALAGVVALRRKPRSGDLQR